MRSELTSSVHTIPCQGLMNTQLTLCQLVLNVLHVHVLYITLLCCFLFFLSCHPLSTTSFRCTPHPPLPFSPTSTYPILPPLPTLFSHLYLPYSPTSTYPILPPLPSLFSPSLLSCVGCLPAEPGLSAGQSRLPGECHRTSAPGTAGQRCVCVCACVSVCAYVHESIVCPCTTSSCHPVQVAPKVSTSHYTMAVIMYMRVSEEGGWGERGGEKGERIGWKDKRWRGMYICTLNPHSVYIGPLRAIWPVGGVSVCV